MSHDPVPLLDLRGPLAERPQQVLAFMKEALPWLEEQEWIVGYAWFPFPITSSHGTSSALFDLNGNLTACGEFYANFTAEPCKGISASSTTTTTTTAISRARNTAEELCEPNDDGVTISKG